MRRAATSLPLPDSPVMYTGACERASFSIMSRARCIAGDSPSSLGVPGLAVSPMEARRACTGRGSFSALVTSGRSRSEARSEARSETTADTNTKVSTMLTGVTTGMTVVDTEGATVGTVTGVTTVGNGSIRTVQVMLTDGRIITLAANSLSLEGDVLTTTSLETNVRSQGALHANINGLINASPNSALASAGVTTLTGLETGLAVETTAGASIGTVDTVFTNRSGAVVGIQVELADGSMAAPETNTCS